MRNYCEHVLRLHVPGKAPRLTGLGRIDDWQLVRLEQLEILSVEEDSIAHRTRHANQACALAGQRFEEISARGR
jgi:hypothetical protein